MQVHRNGCARGGRRAEHVEHLSKRLDTVHRDRPPQFRRELELRLKRFTLRFSLNLAQSRWDLQPLLISKGGTCNRC